MNWACFKYFDQNSIRKKTQPSKVTLFACKWWNRSEPCHHASLLKGTGLTLEGALPSDQDCQPKPAKRARTSFTAEQLQVTASVLEAVCNGWPCFIFQPTLCVSVRLFAGDAKPVCSGQQPWCADATEAGGNDGAEQESHPGKEPWEHHHVMKGIRPSNPVGDWKHCLNSKNFKS